MLYNNGRLRFTPEGTKRLGSTNIPGESLTKRIKCLCSGNWGQTALECPLARGKDGRNEMAAVEGSILADNPLGDLAFWDQNVTYLKERKRDTLKRQITFFFFFESA